LQVLGGTSASFGEPLKSTVLRLLQVLGEYFYPHHIPDSNSRFKKLLQVLGGTSASFGEPVKSRHSDLLQVLGENFHPHQIPDLKSYCKFWGKIFTPSNS